VYGQSCPSSSPATCPTSFAAAQAAGAQFDCASLSGDGVCLYPEGICACSGLVSQPGFTCRVATSNCPATRPPSGSPCSTAPGACTTWGIGSCDNQSMVCECGVWRPVFCYD
jgi:hypothetical protein